MNMTAVWKVTLRSTCLGCLSWPARRGGHVLIAHIMHDIKESVADNLVDEDDISL